MTLWRALVRADARAITIGTTLLLWGITIALNAPGHLSYDSIIQLHEGRTLTFTGHNPPFMSLVLGRALGR